MFFSFGRSAKDKAATRFMRQLHEELANAAIQRKHQDKTTLRAVAERLGMDKGSLSRILSGRGNPTARTIGELAWALDFQPTVVLKDLRATTNAASAQDQARAPRPDWRPETPDPSSANTAASTAPARLVTFSTDQVAA